MQAYFFAIVWFTVNNIKFCVREVSNKSINTPTDSVSSPSRHDCDGDCSRTLLKIALKKSCSISLVVPGLIL